MARGTSGGNIYTSTATITNSEIVTTTSKVIVPENPNRCGLVIYNNSTNSIYLTFGPAANSNTLCCYILASYSQLIMLTGCVYTGVVSGIRNSGTGFCVVTEFS